MCDLFVLNCNILVLIKVYAVLSSQVITSSDVWPELTFCLTPEVYFTLNNASLTCLFGDVRNELSPGQSDGSSPVLIVYVGYCGPGTNHTLLSSLHLSQCASL